MRATILFPALLAGALAGSPNQESPSTPEERQAFEKALAEQGIWLDLDAGLCVLPAEVMVREDYLEYLLVGQAGASHESLLGTDVVPSLFNLALLSIGLEAGRNATWNAKDPQPSEEELRAGALAWDVALPSGDGVYLYVGWREGEEVYLHRAEDLVRDLRTGRSMRRHRWVYLGSQMVRFPGEEGETFAADVYHNLINVSFFGEGYTLLTSALPECVHQTTWIANAWLLPERGTPVALILSRERLRSGAPELIERLPIAGPASNPANPEPDPGERER